MKKLSLDKFIGLVICIMLIMSCSAEDGEDGAIGPQGPQGEQGPEGEQGQTGTADVLYSDWIEVLISDWIPPATVPSNFRDTSINAPEITEEHLNTALILVYERFIGLPVPHAVPLPWMDDAGYERSVDLITVGEIHLLFRRVNLVPSTIVPNTSHYRYIIIPGGIPLNGKSNQVDLTKMSYLEVVEYLGINP
ncbi:MAG: hypothetical protein AAF361_10555 [Bacteroidota bacterium]